MPLNKRTKPNQTGHHHKSLFTQAYYHILCLDPTKKNPIDETELDELLGQIPKKLILNKWLWKLQLIRRNENTNQKSRLLKDFIKRNDLCIHNDKSHTYLHPVKEIFTAIDLTLSDPMTFVDYDWKAHKDSCNSNYFPIVLENPGPALDKKLPSWNVNKANWKNFRNLFSLKLISETNSNNEELIIHFTKLLLHIREQWIPKLKPNHVKHNRFWFDDKYKKNYQTVSYYVPQIWITFNSWKTDLLRNK